LYNNVWQNERPFHEEPETSIAILIIGKVRAEPETVSGLSAGPGFNPQTRQNKLFQDYWRACFEINFSDRQEGLTVSSVICDR